MKFELIRTPENNLKNSFAIAINHFCGEPQVKLSAELQVQYFIFQNQDLVWKGPCRPVFWMSNISQNLLT